MLRPYIHKLLYYDSLFDDFLGSIPGQALSPSGLYDS